MVFDVPILLQDLLVENMRFLSWFKTYLETMHFDISTIKPGVF